MGVAIFIFGAPSLCSGRQIGVGYLHIWCSLAKLGTTKWAWLSSYLVLPRYARGDKLGLAIFIFGAPSLNSGRQIGVGYLHICASSLCSGRQIGRGYLHICAPSLNSGRQIGRGYLHICAPSLNSGRQIGVGYLHLFWCSLAMLSFLKLSFYFFKRYGAFAYQL